MGLQVLEIQEGNKMAKGKSKWAIGVRIHKGNVEVTSAYLLIPEGFKKGDVFVIKSRNDILEATGDVNLIGLRVPTADKHRSKVPLPWIGGESAPTFDVHI